MTTKKAQPKVDRVGPFYTHSEALEAAEAVKGAEVVRDRLWWVQTEGVQPDPEKGEVDA